MTFSKRWQDYATMVFGVPLFISPFVFGETSHRGASIAAYVLGVLLPGFFRKVFYRVIPANFSRGSIAGAIRT